MATLAMISTVQVQNGKAWISTWTVNYWMKNELLIYRLYVIDAHEPAFHEFVKSGVVDNERRPQHQ